MTLERLNEETYTGFIEFTRRNCGEEFLKSFGAGLIDVQVYDVAGSEGTRYYFWAHSSGIIPPLNFELSVINIKNRLEGLYSLVGQRGFYFKNKNGYDGLGGATVQITKNFKTLRTHIQIDYIPHRVPFVNFWKLI